MTPLTEAQMAEFRIAFDSLDECGHPLLCDILPSEIIDICKEMFAAGLAAKQVAERDACAELCQLMSEVLMARSDDHRSIGELDAALTLARQAQTATDLEAAIGARHANPPAPSATVQACRPEDRALLQTEAGQEMVRLATAALDESIPAGGAEFKREPRYVVFKINDIQKYLDDKYIADLDEIGATIATARRMEGKPPFNAVVVEQDWPEFEPTWAAIETRMTGQHTHPAPLADRAGWKMVPVEPTDDMVDAYLNTNTAYWHFQDTLPRLTFKWRNGTPKEATAESLKAAFAAAPTPPAAPTGEVEGCISLEDAMSVVESYGPLGTDVNEDFQIKIRLRDEVVRLNKLYLMAVKGRQEFRTAFAELHAAQRAKEGE